MKGPEVNTPKKIKHKPLCRGCAVFSFCLGHPPSAVQNLVGAAGGSSIFLCPNCKTITIGTVKYDLLTVCAGFYEALRRSLFCTECSECREKSAWAPGDQIFPDRNGDVWPGGQGFPAPYPADLGPGKGPDADGYYTLPDGTRYKLTSGSGTEITGVHQNKTVSHVYIPSVTTGDNSGDDET